MKPSFYTIICTHHWAWLPGPGRPSRHLTSDQRTYNYWLNASNCSIFAKLTCMYVFQPTYISRIALKGLLFGKWFAGRRSVKRTWKRKDRP